MPGLRLGACGQGQASRVVLGSTPGLPACKGHALLVPREIVDNRTDELGGDDDDHPHDLVVAFATADPLGREW